MMHMPSWCFANLNFLRFRRFCCRLRRASRLDIGLSHCVSDHPASIGIPSTCSLLAYLHESIKIFVDSDDSIEILLNLTWF